MIPVILAGSTLLSISANGCSILPSEAARCVFPTAAEIDIPEYDMITVTRTDIINSESIMCIYSSGNEQLELSFNRSGLPFANVYVKKGSIVSEGDLLAELDTGDLKERIYKLEQAIAENEFYLSQENTLKNIEIEKINAQYKYGLISAKTRDERLLSIDQTYSQAARLEQTIYYDKLEYETLCTQLNNSRIYAPTGGLISFVDNNLSEASQASLAGDPVIGLSEFSACRFKATTQLRKYFKDGDVVSITMQRGGTGTYDAVIELDPDDDTLMYLYPTTDIADLDYGARAVFTLIIENRQNVLAVNTNAIKRGQGFEYVYYINENGYRDIKIIETGVKGKEGYTEILSGLEYGEAIIK